METSTGARIWDLSEAQDKIRIDASNRRNGKQVGFAGK
jgi:hypothetical protein